MVDAGQADPSVLDQFVSGVASRAGVTLTPADPMATQVAAQKQYNDMLVQYGLTHPNQVMPNAGSPGDLTDEGKKGFNAVMNNALYGELTPEQKAEKENAGMLGGGDVGNAQVGDKFNITEETKAPNGTVIPAGKYTTISQSSEKGNGFLGSKQTTATYLRNNETGETYKISEDTETGGKRGAVRTIVDPFNWFGL
jgi:hypothetical protein